MENVVNQGMEEEQMEKAHHNLNSIKLFSDANSEPEIEVIGIRTKLSWEPQNLSNKKEIMGIINRS